MLGKSIEQINRELLNVDYRALTESDQWLNDLNREMIEAYVEKYPNCMAGSYEKCEIFKVPKHVRNFEVDFVVTEDSDTIRETLANYSGREKAERVVEYLKETDGYFFIWV